MQQPHLAPSRKDTILMLVIAGWLVCAIASFVSYFMAKQDLEQIDAGLMDGKDRESINMMKIISMVHIGMIVLGVLAGLCFVFAGMLMSLSASSGGY